MFLKQQVVSILFFSAILLILFVFLYNLLKCWFSSDVEVNPRPNSKPNEALSICRWNLNSIFALNFAKFHLLKVYATVHKSDIICLSETYVDSNIAFNNDNVQISDYNLICSNHPSISKSGGVCIYSSFKGLRYKSYGRMYKLWIKNRW